MKCPKCKKGNMKTTYIRESVGQGKRAYVPVGMLCLNADCSFFVRSEPENKP